MRFRYVQGAGYKGVIRFFEPKTFRKLAVFCANFAFCFAWRIKLKIGKPQLKRLNLGLAVNP